MTLSPPLISLIPEHPYFFAFCRQKDARNFRKYYGDDVPENKIQEGETSFPALSILISNH